MRSLQRWRRLRSGAPGLVAAVLLAGLWVALQAGPAGAHAVLRGSDPAAGASLERAPRAVTIDFSEPPDLGLSSIHVLDSTGSPVERGEAAVVPGDELALTVPLGDLPDGSYTVSWRVVSQTDGHLTAGTFAFGVGVAAPVGATTTEPRSETPPPTPLAVVGRWTFYAGLALLVGAAATGLWVFRLRLPAGTWALLGGALALVVVGLVAFTLGEWRKVDVPIGTLLDSSTGQGLVQRAVGLALTAAVLALLRWGPERLRPSSPPAGRAGLVAALLVLLGLAASGTMLAHVAAGHAGDSTLDLAVQWAHTAAVGAWAGGLPWLLLGLRGGGARARIATRFSTLAVAGLAVVGASGLLRAVDSVGSWRGLLDTGFGQVLDVKVLLAAALISVGAFNRFRNVPALAAAGDGAERPTRRLFGAVRVEVAIAAVVLLATGLLTELPPAKTVLESEAAEPPRVVARGSDFATSVRAELTVTPGRPGPNAFAAELVDYDTGAPVAARAVELRAELPDRPGVNEAVVELKRAGDGRWRAQSSALAIAGTWRVELLVEQSAGSVTVPLEVELAGEQPNVQVSRQPGQPDLYTISLAGGASLQSYADPGRAGPNALHFTWFDAGGSELPVDDVTATASGPGGERPLELQRFTPGHVVANAELAEGSWAIQVEATGPGGQRLPASYEIEIT